MVNNIQFVDHEHFCLVCHKEINMMRVKNIINAELHGFHLSIKANDPVFLEDHDNDLEILCSFQCYTKYLKID
jgi:hypothetical protein